MWPLVPLLVGAPGPFEPNISSAPNLNGEYVLSPTPHGPKAQSKFPTHYKDYPGGAEYFTVYSPPISTLYSQVFWKGLDPVPLPDEVVKRYAGRGMAVIGFEMDQVIRGAKGDGSDDIQIPITQAYNHHFESTMTGAKSRMRKVRFTGPDDPRLAALKARHHGHRLPREDEAWVVDELAEGTGGIPTHQAFGGANGGEYRKSFHGYAPGYAQVIDSPEAIQITPMQIDTWQRDAMPRAGQPGAAKFVPGPVPRASLAPTSGPDAIYSGLLECPKTTRVHADLDDEYSLHATGGGCSGDGFGDAPIGNESECFAAAAQLVGANCTQAVVDTPTRPAGCSIAADGAGACEASFNRAGRAAAAACGAGGATAPVAGRRSDLVDVEVSLNTTHATITLGGPADVWYGVGFNASAMGDAPWTLIVEASGDVSERRLGNHNPGTKLPRSVDVVSSRVVAGRRQVVVARALKGAVFSFDRSMTHLPFINAIGSTPTLSYHKDKAPSALALLPVRDGGGGGVAGLCVCKAKPAPFGKAKGRLSYRPNASQPADAGSGAVSFNNDCEPEPRSDLRAMRNPTCDVRTYAGGQTACHHMWSLLDADQPIPWADQPLAYRLKFRFWAQPFNASYHTNVLRTTWGIASPVEYDVPKCADGVMGCRLHTDGRTWVHTIRGTYNGTGRLASAHFHCHAPTCLMMAMYKCPAGLGGCNETTPGATLLCREEPVYGGTGRLDRKAFDEPGYIFQPPCLWGDARFGLEEPPNVTGHVLHTVKTSNATYGHHGEMAWQQMYYF